MHVFRSGLLFMAALGLTRLSASDSEYITIHQSKTFYKILALDDMEETVWKNYTIHNEKGDHAALLILSYDKASKVLDAEVEVKNNLGQLKKYKLRDFEDRAMNDGYSIFSDNRMKFLNITTSTYPIHLDFRYTIKHKNTLGLKRWIPQEGYHIKLESAELLVQTQIPGLVTFKELNFKGTRTINDKSLHWLVDTMVSLEDEVFDTPMEDKFNMVLLSANRIKFDGHQGELGNWYQYGQWVNSLIKERDVLTPEDQSRINLLVPTDATPRSKINTLYKYLQQNTRYVSVQLGIGGFQPMAASEVAKAGYGDCKALSNYMKALLKSVGIPAYYTEIGSGSRKINHADFTSFYQTNHVILTVPGPQDTLFLECTHPYFPPGYVGNDNSDRFALMADVDGGRLIRTPVYTEQHNVLSSHAQIRLDGQGHGTSKITTQYGGAFYEPFADFEIKGVKEKREELIKTHPGIDFTLDSFDHRFDFTGIPAIVLNEHAYIKKYASISGTRMFIPFSLMHPLTQDLLPNKSRLNEIVIPIGITQKDTLSILIPSGYEMESIPKPISIKTPFGELESHTTVIERTIQTCTTFILFKSRNPKESYAEFSDLLAKAFRVRQSKLVIKKSIEKP